MQLHKNMWFVYLYSHTSTHSHITACFSVDWQVPKSLLSPPILLFSVYIALSSSLTSAFLTRPLIVHCFVTLSNLISSMRISCPLMRTHDSLPYKYVIGQLFLYALLFQRLTVLYIDSERLEREVLGGWRRFGYCRNKMCRIGLPVVKKKTLLS